MTSVPVPTAVRHLYRGGRSINLIKHAVLNQSSRVSFKKSSKGLDSFFRMQHGESFEVLESADLCALVLLHLTEFS